MIAALLPLVLWDFALSDGGWVPGGFGPWEWGTEQAGPSPNPVWATVLDGNYANDATATLQLPTLDLDGLDRPVLVIDHRYQVLAGDAASFEVNEGDGWKSIAPIYGYPGAAFVGNSGWVRSSIDLSSLSRSPRLRLVLRSDLAQTAAGWTVARAALYNGDATPPQVSPIRLPEDTQDLDGPYVIELDASDNVGVTQVTLFWSAAGGSVQSSPALQTSADRWRAEIPAQPPDTVVRWFAVVDDAEQQVSWPSSGSERFRVFLAAPTELEADLPPHAVATEVHLRWTPPDSPHPVLDYQLTEIGGESRVVRRTEITVTLSAEGSHRFEVVARYQAGLGDPSDQLSVKAEVPSLAIVEPTLAYPGEMIWLVLQGLNPLYLLDGVTTLDLGPGVSVEDIEVIDVQRLVARVQISPSARSGPRTIELLSTQGLLRFEDAFEIGQQADAPQVISITPGRIVQGEARTVVVEASEDFAGPIRVEVDSDLVVPSDVVVDGAQARFTLAAIGRSRVGAHTLLLDDGQRLWAAEIDVDEFVSPPARQCRSTPGVPPVLVLWLLPWLIRRRRR